MSTHVRHGIHGLMHGLLRLVLALVLLVFIVLNPMRTGRILYRLVNTFVMFGENLASGRYMR